MSVSQKYLRDENGNIFSPIINVDSIYNGGGGTLFDSIYPVGSIYLSINSTNPSTLFGGTWEAISGRFLIGVGKNTDDNNETWEFALNQAHGEYNHTLTINQIPSHRHDFENIGRVLFWDAGLTGIGNLNGGNLVQYSWGSRTAYTGGNAPHNNMPPYLAVYIWKRIS